jgi:signal transduction histidine kinase
VRRQLALTTAAIASMIVVAFVVPLGLLVRTIAADRAVRGAEGQATALVPVLATVTDRSEIERVVDGVDRGGPARVTVFAADGSVLGAPAGPGDADGLALARSGRSFSTGEGDGTAVYVPVVRAEGVDVVRAVVPAEVARRGVAPAWAMLGGLGFVLVAAAVAVADRIGRQMVEPVLALATVASRLGRGDLDARVEPGGPPEIVEVGHTLNELAGRIGGLLEAEREALADLSHRLRTPVTALRLDAESVTDPADRDRLTADVDALQAAVTKLISDARRARGRGPATAGDLVAATAERTAFWAALAEDQGRAWTLDLPEDPCPIAVGTEDLDAALDALLGNVLAHTPDGVAFHVAVRAVAGDGFDGAELSVIDEGPGFGAEARERGVSGGGSSGLGLDIVRQTAEAAGGTLTTGPNPDGPGACVRARFAPPPL